MALHWQHCPFFETASSMENMCCAASAGADPAFLGSSSSCLCPTVPSPAKLGVVVYYHSICFRYYYQ